MEENKQKLIHPQVWHDVNCLREDINIVAQHIVAIRNEAREKMQVLSDTADHFEQTTKTVLEAVIEKISSLEQNLILMLGDRMNYLENKIVSLENKIDKGLKNSTQTQDNTTANVNEFKDLD